MPNRLIKIMAFVIGLFPFAAFLAAGDAVDPATAGADPSVPEITSQGYKLAFSDEFNGTKLDEEKWVYRVDSKGLSTELPANATVSDGLLHLAVKKESAKGKAYTGGGIISKAEFQYGYYEARLKVPPGKGWHTSFWTMHYNGRDTNPTQGAQEIDICEQDSGQPHSGYAAGVNAWGAPLKNIFLGRRNFNTPDLARDYYMGDGIYPDGREFLFRWKIYPFGRCDAVCKSSRQHLAHDAWLRTGRR
jgi:hypothetical protein